MILKDTPWQPLNKDKINRKDCCQFKQQVKEKIIVTVTVIEKMDELNQ